MTNKTSEPVWVEDKVVGVYYPATKTFKKALTKKRHFFWSLASWGFDLDALMILQEKGCERVEILEKTSREVYTATMKDILTKGIAGNFGHGRQVFLHESFFTLKNGPVKQQEFHLD